jgi:hypothetical protein
MSWMTCIKCAPSRAFEAMDVWLQIELMHKPPNHNRVDFCPEKFFPSRVAIAGAASHPEVAPNGIGCHPIEGRIEQKNLLPMVYSVRCFSLCTYLLRTVEMVRG